MTRVLRSILVALAAVIVIASHAVRAGTPPEQRDDGWAVAELVRSLGPSGPRIVFSTGAPQDIPEQIAEMGCVMEKPYDPKELVEVLTEPKRRGLISRLRAVLK